MANTLFKKTFGERVKQKRKMLGIPQDILAGRLGVSQSLICKIEQGEIEPRMLLGYQITLILKIPFNDILTRSSARGIV